MGQVIWLADDDEERRVRLYYVPHSTRLTNIEVLEDTRAAPLDARV